MSNLNPADLRHHGLEAAIIGMAARFPGASDLSEYWRMLINGEESISSFTRDELLAAGISSEVLDQPGYVRAGSFINNKDHFDYAAFGYTPDEAAAMDPQIRIFHESVAEALDDAAIDPWSYKGVIGVYAGAGPNFKWEAFSKLRSGGSVDDFTLRLLNDKDYLATRIAHRFNFRGPALTMNTACSTSLAAVHMAVRGLLMGECDVAVAGGVSLSTTARSGYLHKDGMILSPDGHCRSFNADAAGTVSSEGAGVVIIKRLGAALADKDHIWAVIRGSAVNNDGNSKVGYSAPSVDGQKTVIRKAIKMARVSPDSIRYIETHGTGTVLGDEVELEALSAVFKNAEPRRCALGAVKGNIGHADAAAGIAGLIKAALALSYRKIPPVVHVSNLNRQLRSDKSPFFLNKDVIDYNDYDLPLLAGVSSMGIGGTNVHMILESPPAPYTTHEERINLCTISGRTPEALERNIQRLAPVFHAGSPVNPSDACYSLQRRPGLRYRASFLVEGDKPGWRQIARSGPVAADAASIDTVWLFPGQGAQYPGMSSGIYKHRKSYASIIDSCLSVADRFTDADLRKILFDDGPGNTKIHQTAYTQPLLFMVEYALGKMMMEWGITPSLMVGHSIGEYVAACLSGVMTVEDAIRVVIKRGELIGNLSAGAMVSVAAAITAVRALMGPDMDIAAINTPDSCVLSGGFEATEALEDKLRASGIPFKRLHTSHAFHSRMMEPALDGFASVLRQVKFSQPNIPFISNVTGKIARPEDVCTPEYWMTHLRQTVRFSDSISGITQLKSFTWIEAGPGNVLGGFVQSQVQGEKNGRFLNLMPPARDVREEDRQLMVTAGKMWTMGVVPDLKGIYEEGRQKVVSLPAGAFDPYRFPATFDLGEIIEDITGKEPASGKEAGAARSWYYAPVWRQALPALYEHKLPVKGERVMVLMENSSFCSRFGRVLAGTFAEVIFVHKGSGTELNDPMACQLDPARSDSFGRLFSSLALQNRLPDHIIDLWNLESSSGEVPSEEDNGDFPAPLFRLLRLAQAIGDIDAEKKIRITVITNELQDVGGDEHIEPLKATLLGAIKVIPLELLNVSCSCVDIAASEAEDQPGFSRLSAALIDELMDDASDVLVSLRKGRRYVLDYVTADLQDNDGWRSKFDENGVYLISGGLGGMGLSIARFLSRQLKVTLLLVGRTRLPARAEWKIYLEKNEGTDIAEKIRALLEMESNGAKVYPIVADVSDVNGLRDALAQILPETGPISGVIQAAGVIDQGGIIMTRTDDEMTSSYLRAKTSGTIALQQVVSGMPVKFFVVFSSIGNVLYSNKFGQVSYNAANEFLESFAAFFRKTAGFPVQVINWCDWRDVGMSVKANQSRKDIKDDQAIMEEEFRHALTPAEGVQAFCTILGSALSNVTVTKTDLKLRREKMKKMLHGHRDSMYRAYRQKKEEYYIDRPGQSTDYVAPNGDFQVEAARMWQDLLGIRTIGVSDNFFELGGDSLKAMTMLSRLKAQSGLALPLKVFMSDPTICAMEGYSIQMNRFRDADASVDGTAEMVL